MIWCDDEEKEIEKRETKSIKIEREVVCVCVCVQFRFCFVFLFLPGRGKCRGCLCGILAKKHGIGLWDVRCEMWEPIPCVCAGC